MLTIWNFTGAIKFLEKKQNENHPFTFLGGTWTEWTEFSGCSKTCGSGSKTRTRICNGGKCSGEAIETKLCQTEECKIGKSFFYNIFVCDFLLSNCSSKN